MDLLLDLEEKVSKRYVIETSEDLTVAILDIVGVMKRMLQLCRQNNWCELVWDRFRVKKPPDEVLNSDVVVCKSEETAG
jgi:hypothetical protein